jgi:hypothetical protein
VILTRKAVWKRRGRGGLPPPSSTGAWGSKAAGAEKALVVGAAKAKVGVAEAGAVLEGSPKEGEGMKTGAGEDTGVGAKANEEAGVSLLPPNPPKEEVGGAEEKEKEGAGAAVVVLSGSGLGTLTVGAVLEKEKEEVVLDAANDDTDDDDDDDDEDDEDDGEEDEDSAGVWLEEKEGSPNG